MVNKAFAFLWQNFFLTLHWCIPWELNPDLGVASVTYRNAKSMAWRDHWVSFFWCILDLILQKLNDGLRCITASCHVSKSQISCFSRSRMIAWMQHVWQHIQWHVFSTSRHYSITDWITLHCGSCCIVILQQQPNGKRLWLNRHTNVSFKTVFRVLVMVDLADSTSGQTHTRWSLVLVWSRSSGWVVSRRVDWRLCPEQKCWHQRSCSALWDRHILLTHSPSSQNLILDTNFSLSSFFSSV